MEKPTFQNSPKMEKPTQQKRKLPTPLELISHYEAQGMDPQSASAKVIEDLQGALVRVIAAGKKDKSLVEAFRKLDAAVARLAVVDAKLDAKPGFGETFAIGVASGLAVNGIGAVLPHVVGAVSNIWNSVRSVSKDPHS